MTEKEKMKISMLAEVATMYYERGLTQNEIAEILCVSRTSVSRMLTAAAERGIIQVRINYQFERHYELERQITERFPVKNVYVLNNRGKNQREIEFGTSSLAAGVLKKVLAPDISIGVTWGNTLSDVVDCLEAPSIAPDGVEVIQLTGAVSKENPVGCSQSIVSKLSEKLSGCPRFLNAPLLVESAQLRKGLKEEPNNAKVLRRAEFCDVALTSVGLCSDVELKNFGSYMTKAYADEIIQKGGIGSICGRFFDREGRELDCGWNRELIGIDLAELKQIPNVFCVSYEPQKAPAIRAVLQGKLVDTLVTDGTTATKMLNLTR